MSVLGTILITGGMPVKHLPSYNHTQLPMIPLSMAEFLCDP